MHTPYYVPKEKGLWYSSTISAEQLLEGGVEGIVEASKGKLSQLAGLVTFGEHLKAAAQKAIKKKKHTITECGCKEKAEAYCSECDDALCDECKAQCIECEEVFCEDCYVTFDFDDRMGVVNLCVMVA